MISLKRARRRGWR